MESAGYRSNRTQWMRRILDKLTQSEDPGNHLAARLTGALVSYLGATYLAFSLLKPSHYWVVHRALRFHPGEVDWGEGIRVVDGWMSMPTSHAPPASAAKGKGKVEEGKSAPPVDTWVRANQKDKRAMVKDWIHQNPLAMKDMLAAHFVCLVNDLVNSDDDPGHAERMRGVRETTVRDLEADNAAEMPNAESLVQKMQERASVGVKRAERTAPKHRLEYGRETLVRAAIVMEDQEKWLPG
ncbi:hypothetical protein T484DRAFT_1792992, partial [Baffinella frigidus]